VVVVGGGAQPNCDDDDNDDDGTATDRREETGDETTGEGKQSDDWGPCDATARSYAVKVEASLESVRSNNPELTLVSGYLPRYTDGSYSRR
jgi:hypothetical protein